MPPLIKDTVQQRQSLHLTHLGCIAVVLQGIIAALRERSEALKAAKVQIFVRR